MLFLKIRRREEGEKLLDFLVLFSVQVFCQIFLLKRSQLGFEVPVLGGTQLQVSYSLPEGREMLHPLKILLQK